MKKIILIHLLILLTTCYSYCQVKTDSKDILLLESQISQAVLDNDTAKFSSFLVDDYSFSVPEGNNISKAQFLLDMKKFWHPTAINRTDQRVRIYKNLAIVTGLAESKWISNNREMVARERYTDTYMYDGGKWLLVAGQSCEEAMNDKSVYENEVKEVLSKLWLAWETGNRALAEPIYAKDFIDTDFDGVRRNKEEVLVFLNPLKQGESAKIELSDWHFIVKNNTVVTSYVGKDTRTKEGKSNAIQFRATDTFIKKYGHWQMISGQQVKIDGKE